MRYLITYDISEDSVRNKLIKFLNEYGKRVQFSCFEIEASKIQLVDLIKKINDLINKETDKVFLFPISKYAAPFVRKLGKNIDEDNPNVVL